MASVEERKQLRKVMVWSAILFAAGLFSAPLILIMFGVYDCANLDLEAEGCESLDTATRLTYIAGWVTSISAAVFITSLVIWIIKKVSGRSN